MFWTKLLDSASCHHANELPAVVEFVQNGGLERAQSKTASELAERLRQQDKQARLSMIERPAVSSGEYHSTSKLGGLLEAVGFLFS